LELVVYESDNNIGSGAIVANFHIASETGNKVDIVQMAQLATTGETGHDQKIANELVSSIKEQYEAQGSGIKKPFHGPSAKHLKASEPVHESTHGSPGSELVRSVFPRITHHKDPFPTCHP
jgi:hypothetical protein